MQKISSLIFNISPKRLAIYLLLGPLILFLVHTATTIIFRNISETSATMETVVDIILGILFLFLVAIFFLWLLWLRSVVFSIKESDLGLPRRWFNIAFILFIAYLLYNLCFDFFEYIPEDYQHVFYALNEFIGFGGLLIAYPLICHYAARAATATRSNKPATFASALPFTLVLIFGAVLSIPFLHKYFSTKSSTNSQIIIIYAIAIGIFIFLLIAGFLAAITGLV